MFPAYHLAGEITTGPDNKKWNRYAKTGGILQGYFLRIPICLNKNLVRGDQRALHNNRVNTPWRIEETRQLLGEATAVILMVVVIAKNF